MKIGIEATEKFYIMHVLLYFADIQLIHHTVAELQNAVISSLPLFEFLSFQVSVFLSQGLTVNEYLQCRENFTLLISDRVKKKNKCKDFILECNMAEAITIKIAS